MPPENQVIPWMLLQSVRINITSMSENSISFTIKDPSRPGAYWGSVGREKSPVTKFMNKPEKEITKTAQDITAGATTPDEKLQKLYQYCQSEISNTTFDPAIADEQKKKLADIKSVGDVLKRNKPVPGS